MKEIAPANNTALEIPKPIGFFVMAYVTELYNIKEEQRQKITGILGVILRRLCGVRTPRSLQREGIWPNLSGLRGFWTLLRPFGAVPVLFSQHWIV